MFPFIRNGKIYVPISTTPNAGETIGDAMRELKPDELRYEETKAWLEETRHLGSASFDKFLKSACDSLFSPFVCCSTRQEKVRDY
jgi:hypothetical protein